MVRRLARSIIGDQRAAAPVVLPALVFLLLATLSALLAPTLWLEALKFVSRFVFGLCALLLVAQVVTTRARLVGLLWAIVLGAGTSAFIGLGQAAGWSVLDPILALFAVGPTRVGGELRVNGTFQYATITSMFFELTVPLALAVSATARARAARLLALAIAVAGTATVVLTLTRAGLLTLVVVFGLMLGLAWRRPKWRSLAGPTAVSALSLVILVGLLAIRTTAFQTRLTTENDLNWYGATYTAPATLTLTVGDPVTVTVEARNTGQATWTASGERSFALGYRWLSGDGESALSLPHGEVGLTRDVTPGETIRLAARVAVTPPPGNYRLAWSMLQRNVLWFYHRDVPEAETLVEIRSGSRESDATTPPAQTAPRDDRPAVPLTVGRTQLWPVALRLVAERPLLGVGPDNFRLLYGPYLGLTNWDTSIHANNLYLELLADLGLAGAAAFGWLLIAASLQLARVLRNCPAGSVPIWAVGVGGSLLAFLVHGLVDYFLEFTPLYLLFWMTLGLIVALQRVVGSE